MKERFRMEKRGDEIKERKVKDRKGVVNYKR